MTPEVFAEWLMRQGYRVVRTKSSYWFNQGPGVFQAFPYHWIIQPSEEELLEFLTEEKAIGLRYSTPMEATEGACSYHVVYDRLTYDLKDVESSIRSKVRKGQDACSVGPITLDRYAKEGWSLERDTQHRQHRQSRRGQSRWEVMVEAAKGLDGFEVWGAEVKGQLAATLMFAQIDDCVDLLFQQSQSEFLPLRVNNALLFDTTKALIARPDVHMVHNGLHSLDAPASVDQFKIRHGYALRPVRQRVMFHPLLAPFIGLGTARHLERLASLFPKRELLQKAEGLARFYCSGKLPLPRQQFPDLLKPFRIGICEAHGIPSLLKVEHLQRDGMIVCISPGTPADLAALTALHMSCPQEEGLFNLNFGQPFVEDAFRWFLTSQRTLILVAKAGDRLVGLSALSEGSCGRSLLYACKWTVLLGILRRPWLTLKPDSIYQLSSMLFPSWTGHSEKVAQLAIISVTQDIRGQDIGQALKRASVQACRDWGMDRITAAVHPENLEAKMLIGRLGFREFPGKRSGKLAYFHMDITSRTIGFRKASMSDIPGIIRIHQAAFPDFFMTTLGPRFLKIYYQKVLLYPENVFLVKEGDEELEGFVSGFINPDDFYTKVKSERFSILLALAFRLVLHPSKIRRLLDSYSEVRRSMQKHEPGACELSSIAVSPRFSGRGVGQALVKQFIQSVIGKANAIQLTTDSMGNDDVNRFYRNLGFVQVGSYERSKGRWMNKYRLFLETPRPMA